MDQTLVCLAPTKVAPGSRKPSSPGLVVHDVSNSAERTLLLTNKTMDNWGESLGATLTGIGYGMLLMAALEWRPLQ